MPFGTAANQLAQMCLHILQPMKRAWILVILFVVLAAGAAWWWHLTREPAPTAVEQASPPAVAASEPQAPASVPMAGAPPAPAEPLKPEEISAAVETLVGAKAALTFFQLDQIPRRLVATVDNLGLAHAPSALWPVQVTAGRFTVDDSGGSPVIAADNASRYTPLVLLAETINTGRAVELFLRMYPLLQREYEQLGYPGREFNQRLQEVVALLLATPEPEQPPQVQLLEVKGPIPSARPWVRYEFADPSLEQLTAGQKILVRVGLVNERRLKKKLVEFRDELRRQSQSR